MIPMSAEPATITTAQEINLATISAQHAEIVRLRERIADINAITNDLEGQTPCAAWTDGECPCCAAIYPLVQKLIAKLEETKP